MSGGESEEKKLPASAKKLREARKRGQVANAKDIVIAAGTICALGFLVATGTSLVDRLQGAFGLAAEASRLGLREGLGRLLPGLLEIAGDILVPFVLILILTGVLANMVMLGGVLFAIDPVVPRFEKINPVSGFERIFSMKNLIELLKSLAKIVFGTVLVVGIVAVELNDIVRAPRCGPACLGGTFGSLFTAMAAGISGLFLSVGLLDVGLQRWLFQRDMRMTRTEAKRERKDSDGDPHVRSERRRRRKELLSGPRRLGVQNATLLIADPGRAQAVVAIRYVRGETPVPIIVAKARGERVAQLCLRAYQQRVVVADDAELALRVLQSGAALGEYVPQPLFAPVAQCIVRHCGLPG